MSDISAGERPIRMRRMQAVAAGAMGALLLLCARALPAQSSAANLSGIAHVAIRVSDLEQSRAFFHKLGFEEAFAMDRGGTPTEAFFKINDRQFIELYPRRNADDWVGFMHICFESPDLNALYRDYVAHGLTPTPVKTAGAGNLLFTLQGPVEPGEPSDLRGKPTQNIEYTQYMPGSRHTLDRGQHLGTDRIAERIAGVGMPVQDPAAATSFYEEKLSFRHAAHRLQLGVDALALPGSEQRIEFLGADAAQNRSLHFRLIFSVPDLRKTHSQLRRLGFRVNKQAGDLAIEDPDGDAIVFMAAEH